MAWSNRACIAPKTLPCTRKGRKFKINRHFCRKCKGVSCRYLILLDELPVYMLDAVRAQG